MIHIGICGSESSLNLIQSVTNELNNTIKFIEFPYKNINEINDIIKIHSKKVNGWLFSNHLSYQVANEALNFEANNILSTYVHANLYKTLLEINKDRLDINKKISIEISNTEDEFQFQHLLNAINLDSNHFKTLKIEATTTLDIISDFHLTSFQSDEAIAAITLNDHIYETLKKLHIPVYKLTGTSIEIKNALNLLTEKIKSHSFKNSQIAVAIINIKEFESLFSNDSPNYKWQKTELNIKRILLDFCEESSSSLIENGLGKYQIFSVRNHIEKNLQALKATIFQMMLELKTNISIGIGYATSAADAEKNARKAVQEIPKSNTQEVNFTIIKDNNTSVQTIKNIEVIYSHDISSEINKLLRSISVNVSTFNKIKALSERLNWIDFTANDVSEHLSMTLRNAQRIVSKLVEVNLLEEYSERTPIARGRGRKTYRFK